MNFLVFSLVASIGAMGGPAGHERRGTGSYPGRSLILGMLAAAFGIERDDIDSSPTAKMLASLKVHVGVVDAGHPMRDFHTVQTVPVAQSRRMQTRREALLSAQGKEVTSISLRDYRTSVFYVVALEGEPALLKMIEKRLREPVFQLYLGRKACSLSFPPAPKIVQADSFEAAMAEATVPDWKAGRSITRIVTEDLDGPGLVQTVSDVPMDRASWLFGSRSVRLISVDVPLSK